MGCSTFFFSSPEDLEAVRTCLEEECIKYQEFTPSSLAPFLRIWAISVGNEDSGRTRELIVGRGNAIIGYYNLPGTERLLCGETLGRNTEPNDQGFIQKIWFGFIGQCFADQDKIRLIAHHKEDVGPLLPYLNTVLKAAQYNPNEPTLSFKKGVRMITLYRHKIAIAKADDLVDAWLCLKEAKDRIDYISEHKTEIVPNFEGRKPPGALIIYKLLPQSNCGRCGKPTCMAFAALLLNGEAETDDCAELFDARFEEKRSRLLELLGQTK